MKPHQVYWLSDKCAVLKNINEKKTSKTYNHIVVVEVYLSVKKGSTDDIEICMSPRCAAFLPWGDLSLDAIYRLTFGCVMNTREILVVDV